MDFVDHTLVRLADESTRGVLFDDSALAGILAAAYDVSAVAPVAPYRAVFDELTLGVASASPGVVEGSWYGLGGLSQTEARFQISGLGERGAERVDAIWRGAIVASTVRANDAIQAVQTTGVALGGIDAQIMADLGSLPADAAELEQERRVRLRTRLAGTLAQPDALTDRSLDALLSLAGLGSAGDLLDVVAAGGATTAVRVTYAPPANTPPTPRSFPLAAALLIRGADLSVTRLLAESKAARERLGGLAIDRPRDPSLPLKQPLVVVWLVPASIFDDADWPGAAGATDAETRANRRTAASVWLAREGIALAAVT